MTSALFPVELFPYSTINLLFKKNDDSRLFSYYCHINKKTLMYYEVTEIQPEHCFMPYTPFPTQKFFPHLLFQNLIQVMNLWNEMSSSKESKKSLRGHL